MLYRKLVDVRASADRQETLALIEIDAWVRFASASLTNGGTVESACVEADALLKEFRDRFEADE